MDAARDSYQFVLELSRSLIGLTRLDKMAVEGEATQEELDSYIKDTLCSVSLSNPSNYLSKDEDENGPSFFSLALAIKDHSCQFLKPLATNGASYEDLLSYFTIVLANGEEGDRKEACSLFYEMGALEIDKMVHPEHFDAGAESYKRNVTIELMEMSHVLSLEDKIDLTKTFLLVFDSVISDISLLTHVSVNNILSMLGKEFLAIQSGVKKL